MTNTEKTVQEAYATIFILMNLGFSAEDIHVGARIIANAEPPGLHSVVVLKSRGKEFIYHQIRLDEDKGEDEFIKAWGKFIEDKGGMSEKQLDELVHTSEAWWKRTELIIALENKGFFISSSKPSPDTGTVLN